jgi:sugar/nucleoside kinase (ribokinase family)
MKILVVGELNVDLLLSGYRTFPAPGKEVLVDDLVLALGSSSAICAAGLARLGNQVSFLGKVGCDPWGEFCVKALDGAGVDTRLVIRDSAVKTGLTASVTSANDRALVTYLGAIAELKRSDVPDRALAGMRHLHVSAYYLQNGLRPRLKDLFEAAHAHGLTTSLDTGYDPTELWGGDLHAVLPECDVFLPNEVEIRAITGKVEITDALESLRNGRTLTMAKLGAEGAMTLGPDGFVHVPAIPVTPVDTTGAGDSFNAGFLHAWLRGMPLAESMQFACACGALSTLGIGGTGAQPTEEQARAFLVAN